MSRIDNISDITDLPLYNKKNGKNKTVCEHFLEQVPSVDDNYLAKLKKIIKKQEPETELVPDPMPPQKLLLDDTAQHVHCFFRHTKKHIFLTTSIADAISVSPSSSSKEVSHAAGLTSTLGSTAQNTRQHHYTDKEEINLVAKDNPFLLAKYEAKTKHRIEPETMTSRDVVLNDYMQPLKNENDKAKVKTENNQLKQAIMNNNDEQCASAEIKQCGKEDAMIYYFNKWLGNQSVKVTFDKIDSYSVNLEPSSVNVKKKLEESLQKLPAKMKTHIVDENLYEHHCTDEKNNEKG